MNDSIVAIEGAIREAGFKSMCIRGEHFSERIMDKALGEIRTSRFIVVDLTGARGSVFFEAGFAHGLGIEAIYVFKDDGTGNNTSLEFYVKHYQCYKYKSTEELRSILVDAIRARMVAK
jgi:nucleoside 2-deoxyribosyltransferase